MTKIVEKVEEWEEETDDGGFKEYMDNERQKVAKETRNATRSETAKIMLTKNYNINDISEITGLSINKIMSLK